jgi:cob(I)alamin adenosyltransferase
MAKIYTKNGDNGTTTTAIGKKVTKNDPYIEAYGQLDELNCAIGVVLSESDIPKTIQTCLRQIQAELFEIGNDLENPKAPIIQTDHITYLEQQIDELSETLPPLHAFILPNGNPATAHCHLARAICRRAERRLTTLQQQHALNPLILKYMNRLADLLFVIARTIHQ